MTLSPVGPSSDARASDPLWEHLDDLVAVAVRAPSIHNTQPWRFRYHPGSIELLVDRSRMLPFTDPDGREITVSCGTALTNLRLAVQGLGYTAVTRLLPGTDDRDLMATVSLGEPATINPSDRSLLSAVTRRHTHRGTFSPEPVASGLLQQLRRDAVIEGAELHIVTSARIDALVESLIVGAEQRRSHDAHVRSEIRAWTPPPSAGRRDGIPVTAYAAPTDLQDHPHGGARDFDLGRGQGRLYTGDKNQGLLAIVTTRADGPYAWLQAGQGLQRVLLRAASSWVFASLYSQPTEFEETRKAIAEAIGSRDAVQMVMRLGHASVAQTTPRRHPSDMIAIPEQ